MVPEYEAHFMELLRYAPHLNTEKLKVHRFVFSLNGSLKHCMMPSRRPS